MSMCVVSGLLFLSNVHGQELGNLTMDLAPVETSDASNVPHGLESNLKALLETTRRVRERLNQPTAASKTETPILRDPSPTLIPSFDQSERDAPEKVNDLRDRIRLLRRLRSAAPTTLPSPAVPVSPQPVMIPPSPSPIVAPTQPTLSAIESNLEEKQPSTDSVSPQAEVISATQILSIPVDHLSLGESLYQTQNYPAALKSLQAVNADDLSLSDRTWLELLTALCHRRLGDTDRAAAEFREISNAKIADRSVPIARWLLKQTELVQNAKPALESVSAELDTLIERSNAHVQ
ncbi:MAG: tetratricopeptide repeat protein [Pirellulaceae bacterium]